MACRSAISCRAPSTMRTTSKGRGDPPRWPQSGGIDPAQIVVDGQIVVRFADTELLNLAINNTPIEMVFQWQIAAAKSLTILMPTVYLPRPRLSVTGPGRCPSHLRLQRDAESLVGQVLRHHAGQRHLHLLIQHPRETLMLKLSQPNATPFWIDIAGDARVQVKACHRRGHYRGAPGGG